MNWIDEKENLDRLINEEHVSYEELGRRYGMTGAGIKKAARRLGINLPKKREINPNETFGKGTKRVPTQHCLNCGCEFELYSNSSQNFCSSKCHSDYVYKQYIDDWHNGKTDGTKGTYSLSNHVRRYLFEKYNNSCQICGWHEINPTTGKVPLQVHHIDGNCQNNSEDNLQLLCPNCHSLTDNFGSMNKNTTSGRSHYFDRTRTDRKHRKPKIKTNK